MKRPHLPLRRLTLLALLAALLYGSWPLGAWLNPQANKGLASNLEALHQPYNWLFITFDIMSGLLIFVVFCRLYRTSRKSGNRWLLTALWGYAVFGLLTAADAVLPMDCVRTVRTCPAIVQDPSIIVHGIASIGSISGLTVSILGFWLLLKSAGKLGRLLWVQVIIWLCFGVLTACLIAEDRSSTTAQHLFITLCGVWIVAVPWLTGRSLRRLEYISSR